MVKVPIYDIRGDIVMDGISSVTVIDSIDDESDALIVSCSKSNADIEKKTKVDVFLGLNDQKWDCGSFVLQSIIYTNDGEQLLFTSASFSDTMKKKRTISYQKLNLKELVAKVAKRHGLKIKCDMEQFLEHVDQKNESDMALLKRYADRYNAIFNVKKGTLIFLSKRSEELPMFTVFTGDVESYQIARTNKHYYSSVVVKYHNYKTNKTEEITVGKGSPVYTIEEIQKSQAEAKDIGIAKLDKLAAMTTSVTIVTEGANIVAGGKIDIVGFGKVDGRHLITNVRHIIREKYTTEITIEKAV